MNRAAGFSDHNVERGRATVNVRQIASVSKRSRSNHSSTL